MTKALSLAVALVLAGCGFAAMPKKMDRTNDGVDEMNGKMDRTNAGLDGMSGKIDRTNGGLDETVGHLEKTEEELGTMGAKLERANAGMDGMSAKLDETNTGLGAVNGKLDQTNTGLGAVSGKLDQTNHGVDGLSDQVDDTNDQLRSTNNSLLTLLGEIQKTNDSMDQMNDSIDDMNDQMAVTNAAVHSQILLLALDEMTKPANTLVLFPPIGMMPAGQKFATEAQAEEVLELTHAWMGEIEHANLDKDALKAAGYTDEAIAKMLADLEHSKQVKLSGLQIITGFLPQAKVEAIARHIAENGRYQKAGLAALMFRATFIPMMLLDGGLFAERLTLYGQMVEAIRLVAELDYMGRLPFAARIGFKTTRTGEVLFQPKPLLTRLYKELDTRFTTDLDPAYQQASATDAVIQRQIEELALLHDKVRENLAFWEGIP